MRATLRIQNPRRLANMFDVARILNRCTNLGPSGSCDHAKTLLCGSGLLEFDFTAPITDFVAYAKEFDQIGVLLEQHKSLQSLNVSKNNSTSIREFEAQLRLRLAQRWQCESPIGCDPSDLQQIESGMQIMLPEYYKSFLLIYGSKAGRLFSGHHWSLASRVQRNQRFRLYAHRTSLRQSAFVFLDLDGDLFWYFLLDEAAANPTVYLFDHFRYRETNHKFSEFILAWKQFE